MSATPTDLLLPPGSCLVHIGPPKTGTTAVQGAMHIRRAELHEQGVHYAGRARHSGRAIQAVTGSSGFFTDGKQLPVGAWRRLVADSKRGPNERVVLSSEFFADAQPDAIARIVDDLGRERVHVVVTLRPLVKIVPSQWQQYVQSGMRRSFNNWLDAMFVQPPGKVTPTFWRRHRHDALVQRWADAVGVDNVTVVVADDRDPQSLMRTFEQFTGLREGTLVAERDVANRSLSFPEIEAVRALNEQMAVEKLPSSAQSRLTHFGTARYMMSIDLPPDEARVVTPRWAAERAAEISREMTAAIAASGVRVVGDLSRLDIPVGDAPETVPDTIDVPPAVAARLAMGILHSSGEVRRATQGAAAQPAAEMPQVVRTTSLELARVIAMRGRSAAVLKAKQLRSKAPGRN